MGGGGATPVGTPTAFLGAGTVLGMSLDAAARASSRSFSWAARKSAVLSARLLAACADVFRLSLAPPDALMPAGAT